MGPSRAQDDPMLWIVFRAAAHPCRRQQGEIPARETRSEKLETLFGWPIQALFWLEWGHPEQPRVPGRFLQAGKGLRRISVLACQEKKHPDPSLGSRQPEKTLGPSRAQDDPIQWIAIPRNLLFLSEGRGFSRAACDQGPNGFSH